MEIKNDSFLNSKKKKNSTYYFNENSNNKEDKYNSKLLLSDGIFGSKIQDKYDNLINNSLSNRKNNIFPFPNCKIISSLFTNNNLNKSSNQFIAKKTNINLIYQQNNNNSELKNKRKKQGTNLYYNNPNNNNNIIEKGSNYFLINYKIYNIKQSSIFHIKIYDKFIKYFPIFTNLSELENFICYNPLVENNQNFEIISQDFCHKSFYIRNYPISNEQLEKYKDKYIKHLFTKKNIICTEDIFKYIFEEIKINISCINVQSSFENVLKNCSNLINSINEIIEDCLNEQVIKTNIFINNETSKINDSTFSGALRKIENINDSELKNIQKEDNYIIFNNNKIQKSFILSNINSKGIGNNFLEYNKNNIELGESVNGNKNEIDKNKENNNENDDLSENNEEHKIDEKDKKENFPCPYCSRIFPSHCGLGGHMSKRHPKNQNK